MGSPAPPTRHRARATGPVVLALVTGAAILITAGRWLPPAATDGARSGPADPVAERFGVPDPGPAAPGLTPTVAAGLPPTASVPDPSPMMAGDDAPGVLVAAGINPRPAPDRLARHHVPVLTYHVIASRAAARDYSIADLDIGPERFEDHLRALRNAGWRTITAEGLAEALATGLVPPTRTVVITIDDGFADGFVNALPLLRQYGFIATFYVVPGRMGEPNHLSWDQVRALAAAGMEIGNHTQGHLALTEQPLPDVAREIQDAQAAIERETGQAPTTFAYPFGDVNEAVAAAVEAAGLSLGFTTRGGTTETWETRFMLPRVHVAATLSADSLMRLLDGFH